MAMDTASVRSLILSTPLREESVVIADWPGTNLVIRELDGKTGAALIAACSDSKGTVNQEALVAGIILASLRNADDTSKSLVFAGPDPNVYDAAYRDSLMATGLGRIMQVAQQSIKLSGLDATAAVADAKNASETVVDSSATVLPAN